MNIVDYNVVLDFLQRFKVADLPNVDHSEKWLKVKIKTTFGREGSI